MKQLPIVLPLYSGKMVVMKGNLGQHSVKKNASPHKNEKGQSLIEFVFLMTTMILISFLILRGFNSGIGRLWLNYVKAIAKPTASPIELR